MRLLAGKRVLALGGMAGRPLCRFLETLGAQVQPISEGQDDFGSSIAAADFLVDPWGLEVLADRGLARDRVEMLNPALVHVSVSAFGSGNVRSRWQGAELVASAMGGALRLTGEPDRAPVKEALDACTFHAEMAGAAGAMAAHYARGVHGRGQHVDVSIQEVAFSRNVNGVLVWQFDRRKLHRVGGALNYGRATVRCIWPLADGWCFHTLMTGRFGAPANQGLSDWMDEAGLENPLRGVDWLRYNRSTLDPGTRVIWEQAIAAFFKTRTRAQIRIEGRRRGINACVVASPADVLEDPHLDAREFWVGRDGLNEPSRFARIVRGPQESPSAGQGDAVRTADSESSKGGAARGGPLAGVRILDFSWALVGSITTKVLGDLGADVIKVETRTRPCLSRLDVQVSVSRADDFDDKPWFAHLNTSKRSLAIDLKRPESRDVINPLLGWADAVMENFSPGTMDKLGLGYTQLSQRHPDIVMASGSVYGQTGPLAGEWGVDGTGGALSGRTWMTGWADRDPLVPGAVPYGDVIVPYVLAACIAAALAQRRERGMGCHIDASMYEICVQQMRAAIMAAQQGTPLQRMGNADPAVLQQDVYPARGEDRWVAISVFDEAQRARLAALAGGRPIAEWTRDQEERELVDRLQAAGIAAGVLQDIEDLMEHDPALRARGALVDLPHPRLGPFAHVRTPITFSRDRQQPYRAPGMGEHNTQVIVDVAGLDAARCSNLEATGVLK